MSIKRAAVIRGAIAFILIAIVFTAGLLITFSIANGQKQDYFRQRKIQAATAAASMDYNDLNALKGGPADLDSPAYQRLRASLVRIKGSDSKVRFVYLMRPTNGKMVFLVDAEDPSSPDFSPPGQAYTEAKPADFYVFEGKRPPRPEIEDPVRDRWGTWLSATAYITDSAGKPVALLGTDVDVASALDSFSQTRRLGIMFDSLAAALMVLVALQWIVWKYGKDSRLALQRDMEQSAVRLNEELLKADRVKSDFIQLASHELRSPVNAVNIAMQTLDKTAGAKLSPDEMTLVEVARNGSTRLVDLVDNLLDITRIEAGDFVLRPREADAAELVKKTAQMLEPLAKNKGVGLTTRLPEGPVDCVVDSHTILRVLENLIANAIKFTDFGGVVVELRATSTKLLFQVQDTGPGIPDSFKEELFKKFSRIDRPSDFRTTGAGMGLALCKSMVEAQGGRIWFDSEEGKGATFYFEVPRYQKGAEADGEK